VFLGYVLTAQDIEMDEGKVRPSKIGVYPSL
jgi:hypothetical protein